VSVFDEIRQLQRLASGLTYNQVLAPNIAWSPSMEEVQHHGFIVNISKLVGGVQSMLKDLEDMMYSLSGGVPIKCTIPTDHADDMSSMARGDSWLQGSHTEPREHALMHAMVKQGTWNLNAVNSEGGLTWNDIACRGTMKHVGGMVDLIITLAHMVGPPVRGEEIIRDQYANGLQPRSVYLSFGRIILIRRHSKDTNAKGIDPFNIRYLPKRLSDAICYYLLVIRPLEHVIARHLYRGEDSIQDYDLFLYVKEGKRLTSSQFSTSILQKLTKKYIGVGLTLSPLRHIMIAFEREFVEECKVQKGNTIGDILASHSSETSKKNYAREANLPEGQTASLLLDVRDWCDQFHDAVGLGQRTGPLVPLRTKRKLVQRMESLAFMTKPNDVAGTAADILKEFGEFVYRSVFAEIKPYLSVQVREAVSEAIEDLILANQNLPESTLPQSFGVLRPTQGRPTEAQPRPGPSNGTPSRPTPVSETPTARAPEQIQPPLGPTRPAPPLGDIPTRRTVKRAHSQVFEPASKRRAVDTGVTDRMAASRRLESANPGGASSMQTEEATGIDIGKEFECLNAIDMSEEFNDYGSTSEVFGNSRDANHEPATHPNVPILPTSPPSQEEAMPMAEDQNGVTELERLSLAESNDKRCRGQAIPPPPSRPSDSGHGPSRDLAPVKLSSPPTDEEMLSVLRRLEGDQANFKSDQQRQLATSVVTRKHTVAVIPTGGGKSIAYQFPAICTGQLTIAAFPFKVLVSQAIQTCRDRGIAAQQWTTVDPAVDLTRTRLIIVAMETLLSPTMFQ